MPQFNINPLRDIIKKAADRVRWYKESAQKFLSVAVIPLSNYGSPGVILAYPLPLHKNIY